MYSNKKKVLPLEPPFKELGGQSNILERLIPLLDYIEAWKFLPNVSQWVLHTVEKGYRIQFGSHAPRLNGIFKTVVDPEQGWVLEQEVQSLFAKGA